MQFYVFFDLTSSQNLLAITIYYDELRYEHISQQKAYDIPSFFSKYFKACQLVNTTLNCWSNVFKSCGTKNVILDEIQIIRELRNCHTN